MGGFAKETTVTAYSGFRKCLFPTTKCCFSIPGSMTSRSR